MSLHLHERYQAKLAASWLAIASTGEEDAEFFGEFEVSKEDLQPERAASDSEAKGDSISSKRLHNTSNIPPVLTMSFPASLQTSSEPDGMSPSCTSRIACRQALCEQTSDNPSAPPLSPSVDSSNDSPTLASSVTLAGWESQAAAQGHPAVAPEAAECDDAESWLSHKQSSFNAPSSGIEPQTTDTQTEVANLPTSPAELPKIKDVQDLTLSSEQSHQLQPAGDAIGLTSSPTLQLDLTQQLDTRQHGAAEDDCNPSSSQWPSLLIQEEEHPAADSDAVMHASTASQPVCIDHPNDCRQHLLARSTTYHQPSSCLEGSSLRADPMQHRALSGFLTPLGKLAGMFGWTPGKPNRPWDRPQMSQATIPLDHVHMHNGKEHLTGLARPASASAVSQEVSASLFQVKPQHLTMQQLQDLQKAADLLSPRSMLGARGMEHSPSHAIVSSSMRHPDAQAVVLAASSMTGDASGLVAGECIKQNMFPQPRDHIRGHVPATSDSRLRSQTAAEPNGSPGAGPDSSSSLAKTAAKVGWDSHVAGVTPDDDDSLAAALAARLGMMAPCISSLYGTVHAPCAIGANNCQQQDQEHTLKRNRGEEMDTSQQGLMHVTDFGVAQQADIVPLAGRHDHDVQHMLQKPPPDHTVHARKRFRRTTGLEVLQRCMPALWQNRKELHQ